MDTPQLFSIPSLEGISDKNISEHIKLYEGYVKSLQTIRELLTTLPKDQAYTRAELLRRYAFEYNGMRNHELFFSQFEARSLSETSTLAHALEIQYGSLDEWKTSFIETALTRGVGWAFLSYDKKTNVFINHFVEEQHHGQLLSTVPLLVLDMWEHAYVYDYTTSEKKAYIEAFFKNLNWTVIEERYTQL
jgi:superoxide dismutase, Fe-Mn family